MGWVSFAEYTFLYRALLQKRRLNPSTSEAHSVSFAHGVVNAIKTDVQGSFVLYRALLNLSHSAKKSYISAKEPCMSAKEPDVDPHIIIPCMSAKEADVDVSSYICIRIYADTCAYMSGSSCGYSYVYLHIRIDVCILIYVDTYTWIYICGYIYVDTYMWIHIRGSAYPHI